ncbi:MAG: hypothetical protein ACLRVN_02160 [Butyricicoccus sp.]
MGENGAGKSTLIRLTAYIRQTRSDLRRRRRAF